VPAHGRGAGRNRVRVARHGPPGGDGDPAARLPHRHRGGARRQRDGRARESPGRRALRGRRSAHPRARDVNVWNWLAVGGAGRLVYGARISLGIGAIAMLVAVTTGVVVGGVAGYFRRWVDATLMRLVDVGLAMPRMFMLLMVVALWEHVPLAVLVLLIGLTGWFGTSRLVRAEVLSVRESECVAE